MASVTCLPLIVGEPWSVVVKIQDETNAYSRWTVTNIDPLGGAMLIKGASTSTFATSTAFDLDGNSAPDVNRAYTVATSTNSGSDVIVTVAASVVSLPVAAVDVGTSRLRVTTSSLASVSRFADGATVALSGNVNDASNQAYRVVSSYVPSSPANSLWVELTPSIPPATTASGNLVVPTISPQAGQTAIATINSPQVVDVSAWSFAAELRTGLGIDNELVATCDISTASASSGQLTLSLDANDTAALDTYSVLYLDLVCVSNATLGQRFLRSVWTQGDANPMVLRPTRVDGLALRFSAGGVPVRNIPVVTERP